MEASEASGEDGPCTIRKIKTFDKLKALEMLCRHLGMFDDRLRINDDKPSGRIVFQMPEKGR